MDEMRDMLGACDRALNDCDKVVKDKDAKIKKQEEIILNQDQRIGSLESDQKSVLKNPFVWFAVGLIVGGVAIGVATRH